MASEAWLGRYREARFLTPFRWLAKRFPRQLKFYTINAAVMPGINLGVLALLIQLGLSPVVANLARWGITSNVQFVLHRYWTFRDCSVSWWKFQTARLATSLANQVLFALAMLWLPWGYAGNFLLCSCLVGIPNYKLRKFFAARPSRSAK